MWACAMSSNQNYSVLIYRAGLKHPIAMEKFMVTMIGKQYGAEEMYDAWTWFLNGWNAAWENKKP
jgi:hypothetical protein